MSKQTITIILCLVIIGAFFLPYLSYGSESASGMNIIFGSSDFVGIYNSKSSFGWALFIALLIPTGALLTMVKANPGLSKWLPLAGVVYMLVMLYIRGNTGGDLSIGDLVGFFSYGLWITLAASIALLFVAD